MPDGKVFLYSLRFLKHLWEVGHSTETRGGRGSEAAAAACSGGATALTMIRAADTDVEEGYRRETLSHLRKAEGVISSIPEA